MFQKGRIVAVALLVLAVVSIAVFAASQRSISTSTCGAASLQALLQMHGTVLPYETINSELGPVSAVHSFGELARISARHGLKLQGLELSAHDLIGLGGTGIAAVKPEHFVAYRVLAGGLIEIYDSRVPNQFLTRSMDEKEFAMNFDGKALVPVK